MITGARQVGKTFIVREFARTVPVGYMSEVMMYPLDFEEFLIANGVQPDVMAHLRECAEADHHRIQARCDAI